MRVEIWMWIDLEEWNKFASRRCSSSSTFDVYAGIEYRFRWRTCSSSKLLKKFRIYQKNDAILCETMKKVWCMKFIVNKRKRKYAIYLAEKQPKMKWKRRKTISYVPLGYSGYCGSCCNKLKSGHRQATDEFRFGRIGFERSHTENVKPKWFLGLVCRACVADLMFRLRLAFVGRFRICFSALGICSFRFYFSVELCVEWKIFVNINLFRFFFLLLLALVLTRGARVHLRLRSIFFIWANECAFIDISNTHFFVQMSEDVCVRCPLKMDILSFCVYCEMYWIFAKIHFSNFFWCDNFKAFAERRIDFNFICREWEIFNIDACNVHSSASYISHSHRQYLYGFEKFHAYIHSKSHKIVCVRQRLVNFLPKQMKKKEELLSFVLSVFVSIRFAFLSWTANTSRLTYGCGFSFPYFSHSLRSVVSNVVRIMHVCNDKRKMSHVQK